MKQYFEEQLNESASLTQDVINKMKQHRIDTLPLVYKDDDERTTPKSSFGTTFEKGDTVLYYMVQEANKMIISTVLLREIHKIDNLLFDKMDNKLPMFKKP